MGEVLVGRSSCRFGSGIPPSRAFWLPIIAIDLILLICLSKITLIAGLFLAVVAAIGFLRRVEWLLALLLYGMPLFDPLHLQNDQASLLLIALRLFFCFGWLSLLLGGHGLRPLNSLSETIGPVLKQPATLLMLLLPLWLWAALGWSEAPVYGAEKLKSFLLANLFLYLAGTLLWPVWSDRRGLDGFIRAVVCVGSAIAAIGLAVASGFHHEILTGTVGSHNLSEASRLAWLGSNPIWLARFLAAWCVFLIWAITRQKIHLLVGGALFLIGLYLIIRTGSRGPLAALILSPLAQLLLPGGARLRRHMRRFLPAIALLCLLIIVFTLLLPAEQKATLVAVMIRSPLGAVLANETVADGMDSLLGDQLLTDRSSLFRRGLIETAWQQLRGTLPWGAGTGGFAAVMFGFDFRIYPHNLEIELLFENGWPGLLLMVMFLFLIWRLAFRLAAGGGEAASTVRWLWFLFVMALLNAQVSGDLTGNSHLWFWSGMIVAMQICCKNRTLTFPKR